jgi:hypothetical protein
VVITPDDDQCGVKRCKVCGETKPLDDFYRAAGMRDGHRNDCKRCNLAAKAARTAANPEPSRERSRRWKIENRERYRESQRRAKQTPAARRRERNRHLRSKYGITIEQYEAMLEAQGGVCAICEREPNPNISLHVDHDHETGTIRGLTCFRCNQAMGSFGEDPVLLRAAADYLDRHDPSLDAQREVVRARLRALPPPAWTQTA